MAENRIEIESGQLVVFFVDECHLLWGDVCGYVWDKTDIRIKISIQNEKDRQTYFGALNYQTKEFIVCEYPVGNGESTVDYMKYLQTQCFGRIALIWDGASYHKSAEVKDLLATINDGYEPSQWQFTCILFTPNSPEENRSDFGVSAQSDADGSAERSPRSAHGGSPIEDVWLQTKNFLRKFWYLCKSFPVVKWLFQFFTHHQKFDFPKLDQYVSCS